MLNKFWAQQDAGGLMNNRFYNAIFKIAEAEAKLQLTDKINEEIATQTMESIRLMLLQYAENVRVVAKPSEITLRKFSDILENTKAGVVIHELCRIAGTCESLTVINPNMCRIHIHLN
jgi:DNA replicative helicase MCM subunit Mcm2 (Cdc46/Mcm family)